MSLIVKCPTCAAAVEWVAAQAFRPFCSERCRLIDLGQWADGSNCIPGEPVLADEQDDDLYSKDS